MYAVIESGGKQYKVAIGDRLRVESLNLEPGARVDIDRVLFVADGDDVEVGGPYVASPVTATVVGHGRGEKIRVFKMRRRKNSRQRTGHRQNYTELEIVSIGGRTAEAAEASPEPESAPEAGPEADAAATAQGEGSAVEAASDEGAGGSETSADKTS